MSPTTLVLTSTSSYFIDESLTSRGWWRMGCTDRLGSLMMGDLSLYLVVTFDAWSPSTGRCALHRTRRTGSYPRPVRRNPGGSLQCPRFVGRPVVRFTLARRGSPVVGRTGTSRAVGVTGDDVYRLWHEWSFRSF